MPSSSIGGAALTSLPPEITFGAALHRGLACLRGRTWSANRLLRSSHLLPQFQDVVVQFLKIVLASIRLNGLVCSARLGFGSRDEHLLIPAKSFRSDGHLGGLRDE
jgi:hypothetical protein